MAQISSLPFNWRGLSCNPCKTLTKNVEFMCTSTAITRAGMGRISSTSMKLSEGKSAIHQRRIGNHHADLWDDHVIQSLATPYGASCHHECAETLISDIKSMFKGIGDGEVSPSAYDTAWVARVAAIDGTNRPQFPRTLEWVLENQLKDGSWGFESCFFLSDRLLTTLACVLALSTWKTGHLQIKRGLDFIRNNVELMTKDEGEEFEIIFPALLNEAKLLKLNLPYELPCLKVLREKRESRLSRVSVDNLHSVPSYFLYLLEGLQDVIDWKRIINLQSNDGSFLSSPSSTACVFTHTRDDQCLAFLNNLLAKFGNHVPCLYPIDLLERLYIVDNLQRLGIDRHFQEEIKETLDYVYRYWNEGGIGWGRDSPVADLNTTALGFRTLRLHGYDVSSDVLNNFKDENGDFFCSRGQADKDIRSMLNLFRASNLAFPGEEVMAEAAVFTTKYLKQFLANYSTRHDQMLSVSSNIKNLLGEVEYALEFPWHSSMPRLEARSYIDVYGPDDAWTLKKTLYMMPYVNNQKCLELAKLDFNIIQSLQQEELKLISRFCTDTGLREISFFRQRLVEAYFATASFEPEFCGSRIAFTKLVFLLTFLDDIYDTYGTLDELELLTEALKRWDLSMVHSLPKYMQHFFKVLYNTVNELTSDASKKQGRDMHNYIRYAWEDYFESYFQEAKWTAAQHVPTFDDYLKNAVVSIGFRPLVLYSVLLMDIILPDNILQQEDFPSKFTELIAMTWRLTNDTRSQAEKARGELASCVTSYLKDNRGSTEEDALNHIYGLNDQALKESTLEFFKLDNVPLCFKNYVFNLRMSCQIFYKYGEGFSNSNKETKDYIRKMFVEPVPL